MKITFFAGLRHRLFNMLPYLAVSLLIWTACVLSSFGGERETFFSVFTEAVGGGPRFRGDAVFRPAALEELFQMVDKNRFVRSSLVCALLPCWHSCLRSGGGKSRNAFRL